MQSQTQAQIQQVEISIEHAREMVKRGKQAQLLADNPDFKSVVIEGYFRDEAARLAHLASDPGIDQNTRDAVYRDLTAPGAFKRYLHAVIHFGRMAEDDIEQGSLMLDELRTEEA